MEKAKTTIQILAAGDERGIAEFYRKVLGYPEELGFEITPLGAAAVEAVRRGIAGGRPFAVVLIHSAEHGESIAFETLEEIRSADRCINFVILAESADTFARISGEVVPADRMLFIQSPFYREEVLQAARVMGAMWLSERKLQEVNRELLELNTQLIETNGALSVLARHLESSRRESENRIIRRVRTLIIPVVRKLQQERGLKRFRPELGLLTGYLDNLTADLANDLRATPALSKTEIQVASLIKNGMTSDEIAAHLNISPLTVKTHRKNIRKKLAIRNSGVNLRSFLASGNVEA